MLKWIKLIFVTGAAQIIVQATGLLCGIMVIRLLPTKEYALYTLANTMLGTMTVLADGGISSGVMAQGGKVWQDKEKLGSVLATGLSLRRKFAIVSLFIATPILIFLLLHHGASWLMTLLIIASLIPAFFAALSDYIFEIVPKLHQDIHSLQKNQINVSIGRLILTSLILFVFPWTFVAIIASGIPRFFGNIRLRKIAYNFAHNQTLPDPIIRNEILKNVKRILPESIYYCLSGQISVWLISFFGSTMALASLGAITRIGMIINLFSVLFATLVVPRFARLTPNKEILYKYVIYIFCGAVTLIFVTISLAWVFSSQLLWVIGSSYSDLKHEFFLSILCSCISFFMVCFFSLNVSRGWAINPILYISISIICTIIAISSVNVSTLYGVLTFNIIVSSVQALTLFVYCFYKIKTINEKC